MIQWTATKSEARLIGAIAQRYMEFVKLARNRPTKMEIMMDIEAVHCNGCPLDLDRLLKFPAFDFVRDVAGMHRHVDRDTGKLKDLFLPRCAMPQRANDSDEGGGL